MILMPSDFVSVDCSNFAELPPSLISGVSLPFPEGFGVEVDTVTTAPMPASSGTMAEWATVVAPMEALVGSV